MLNLKFQVQGFLVLFFGLQQDNICQVKTVLEKKKDF